MKGRELRFTQFHKLQYQFQNVPLLFHFQEELPLVYLQTAQSASYFLCFYFSSEKSTPLPYSPCPCPSTPIPTNKKCKSNDACMPLEGNLNQLLLPPATHTHTCRVRAKYQSQSRKLQLLDQNFQFEQSLQLYIKKRKYNLISLAKDCPTVNSLGS